MNDWPWVSRRAEHAIERWMRSPGAAVLVRGHCRSGKSSIVRRVAERLGKPHFSVTVGKDSEEMMKEFATQVSEEVRLRFPRSLTRSIAEAVRLGHVAILREMHNASNSLEVSLQQMFDDIAFESMTRRELWRDAGCVFLMGSVPSVVDSMCGNHRRPLFQRIHGRVNIFSLDTLEIAHLFRLVNISDPQLMLSLHSVFGGNLFPYELCQCAGVLHGDSTDIQRVIEEFLANELQGDSCDVRGWFQYQFGTVHAAALQALHFARDKEDQLEEVKIAVKSASNEDIYAFGIVNGDLHVRYGLVEPVLCINELCSKQGKRFDIVDPLCKLLLLIMAAHSINHDVYGNCGGTQRIVRKDIEHLEMFHFPCWIREIAQDRQSLLQDVSALPGLSSLHKCVFLPNVEWRANDAEFDIVGCQIETRTLILGFCKRNEDDFNEDRLISRFHGAKHNTIQIDRLLEYLGLSCDECNESHSENSEFSKALTMKFYLFVPDGGLSRNINDIDAIDGDFQIVTLAEMLSPFVEEVEKSEQRCSRHGHADIAFQHGT